MLGVYIRVWEYEVPADHVDGFLAAYGAGGDWVQLFKRTAGFIGTELYRSIQTVDRFVTVDRWTDEADWLTFLNGWREAYDALDATLAELGAVERALFEGTLPTSPPSESLG
jgi:heme-degrading monooxygenase HmoA